MLAINNWQPNWDLLEEEAKQYKNSSDLVPKIQQITPSDGYFYTGLFGNLKTILQAAKKVNPHLSGGLVIAVDTLEIEEGLILIPTDGLKIIARSIQIVNAGKADLKIVSNIETDFRLIAASIKGTLFIQLGTTPKFKKIQLTENSTTPQVLSFDVNVSTTSTKSIAVADAFQSPVGILVLELSFVASSALVSQNNVNALALASKILQWIIGAGYALLKERANYPDLNVSTLASLQTNSIGLLVIIQAAASNATYVPILSANEYEIEVNSLITVATVYNEQIESFENQKNQDDLLRSFADTLKDINQDAVSPLFNTLKRLDTEAQTFQNQYINATIQLKDAIDPLNNLQKDLIKAIDDQEQEEVVDAMFKAFFTVANLSIDIGVIITAVVAPEIINSAIGAAENLAKLGENGISDIIHAAESSKGTIPSVKNAESLTDGANALMGAQASFLKASNLLWGVINLAIAGGENNINFTPPLVKAVDKIPNLSGFSIGGLDPVTYWETVVVQVKASVKPLESGSVTGPIAQQYLEAVELAATYGKGTANLLMKLLDLYNQGITAFDRLQAVDQAHAQWTSLEQKLVKKEAKIAAAQGFLQRGFNNIKRSLVLAVNNYRAAFFYQWLQPSSVEINASMSYLELVTAAQNSVSSLDEVLSDKVGAGVLKPSQTFEGISVFISRECYPLFREVEGKGQAQWSISVQDTELANQVNGNTALFLTEATFILEGVEQGGEVELQISTSGNFANHRNQQTFQFVSSPISMTSDYKPGNPLNFITTWKFANEASYLKPTPYTQWTLTVDKGDWRKVTAIKMTISGIFLQNT